MSEIAYHFLRDDYTTGCGNEPPWKVGKTRTIQGTIAICEKGYHASPSWYSALSYADGSIACIVDGRTSVSTSAMRRYRDWPRYARS